MLEEIQSLGASLVALSPELLKTAQTTAQKNGLTFHVLCDEGNRVADKFGIVFELPAELREFYKTLAIDLSASYWRLPLPATYLIDCDATIRDVFINTDYVKRMEPADILAGLRSLTSK